MVRSMVRRYQLDFRAPSGARQHVAGTAREIGHVAQGMGMSIGAVRRVIRRVRESGERRGLTSPQGYVSIAPVD